MNYYAPPNILLVDDEPEILKFMEAALNTMGAHCILCEDGQKALDLIEERKNDYFRLIILDCLLPKVHGFDVLKSLKSSKRTRDIPVIIITGIYKKRNYQEDIIVNKRANGFLPKPFNAADLINVVEPFISSSLHTETERQSKDSTYTDDFSYYGDTLNELPDDDDQDEDEDAPEETIQDIPEDPSPQSKSIPSKGRLSDIPFSEIIRVLHITGSKATIKLIRENEKKIILIDKGQFIWAMSNMIMHTIEHMMFVEGSFSLEQYYYFSKKAFGKQKDHINSQDILTTFTEGERKALLRKQMQSIISEAFHWYDGHYIIEKDFPKISSMEDIFISTQDIIKEGVLSIKNWEIFKSSYKSLQTKFRICKTPDINQLKLAFSLDDLILLKHVKEGMALTAILESAKKPNFDVLQLLYIFTVLGIIEPLHTEVYSTISWEQPKITSTPLRTHSKQEDTETAYKVIKHTHSAQPSKPITTKVEPLKTNTPDSSIESFFQSVINEKNPSKILNLSNGDTKEIIKLKYSKLIKEYHPDKYHSKADQETNEKLVKIIDILNKAYKTAIEKYDDLVAKKSVEIEISGSGDQPYATKQEEDEHLKQQKENIAKNLFIKGRNALLKKDYESAYSSFRYLNSIDSENLEYLGYYGISAYYTRNNTLAFELISKVADSNLNNPDLFYLFGKVYLERNQKTKAKEMFNIALTFDPFHEPSQKAIDSIDNPEKETKDGSFFKKIFRK